MWFQKKINPQKIKERNTRLLRSQGIEVIEHLPPLDHPDFREPEKVARRMMILTAIFQLHLQAPKAIIQKWLAENGLLADMTDEERAYLETDYDELPQQSQINIYWLIEAIWAFVWIGGLHDNLTLHTGVENSLSKMVPNIEQNEPAGEYISGFRLRNQSEIFEMLDKFYRAHWFARNNQLTGKKSDKVDMDMIVERRKALEYTVYKGLNWDDISLDT